MLLLLRAGANVSSICVTVKLWESPLQNVIGLPIYNYYTNIKLLIVFLKYKWNNILYILTFKNIIFVIYYKKSVKVKILFFLFICDFFM